MKTLTSPKAQVQFNSVQFSSVAQLCPTLCNPMNHSMPGLSVHHQLLEFTQTHVHQVGDDIQPSYPLSSPSPPAPNPSCHQVFSNKSTLHMRWPKYWSFSFSINPSNEHPVMLSKAHLTSHSRMSGSGEWSHHRDYLGHEDHFCIVLLCILATSS